MANIRDLLLATEWLPRAKIAMADCAVPQLRGMSRLAGLASKYRIVAVERRNISGGSVVLLSCPKARMLFSDGPVRHDNRQRR